LVSSVSSAIILLMTPRFPLTIPFKQRLKSKIKTIQRGLQKNVQGSSHLSASAQKERERPNRIVDTTEPRRLNKRTGLRPI
jgi:hypothetical protein